MIRQPLADYRLVKHALGGTVNDVILSVVSGALAKWLHGRKVTTAGSRCGRWCRFRSERGPSPNTLGNQLTLLRGPLPVYIDDPVARLAVVRVAMDGLKESKQALGAATLAAMNDLAPPAVLAQASRLQFSTRLFNLLVTNIPGPQFPLYVLGRRLQDMFPLAFLPKNHALAVAIMSFNGRIEYGLLGDYDALPDIGVIATGIESSLAELVAAATSGGASRPAGKRPRPARAGRKPAAGANGDNPVSVPNAAE